MLSLDGQHAERLTESPTIGAEQPAWSADGRSLYFMQGDPRDRMDLAVMAIESREVRVILEGDDDEPPGVRDSSDNEPDIDRECRGCFGNVWF